MGTRPRYGDEMVVRDAVVGEGRTIAEIRIASWRAAYTGLMPQELLDSMSIETGAARFEQAIISGAPGSALLVVEGEGEVRGFAAIGPDRDGELAQGELYAIYLHPSRFRRGEGSALMVEAVSRLRSFEYRTAILWVLEANEAARSFYEAVGWRANGQKKVDAGFGHPLVEIAYARDLRP